MGFSQNSTFGFGSTGDISGGGTVNAAENGLSLVGGNTVVLGQDVGQVGNPAVLLSNREIPTGGFYTVFSGSGDLRVENGRLTVGVISPAVPSADLEIRRDGATSVALIQGNNATLTIAGISGTSGLIFNAAAGAYIRTPTYNFIFSQPSLMGAIGSYSWITFENSNQNQSTGAGVGLNSIQSFLPSSGTSTFAALQFSDTINQTGGANGITRTIFINPTITSAVSYRALEIASNSGYAIYQSSASSLNFFNALVGIKNDSAIYPLDVFGRVGFTTVNSYPTAGFFNNLPAAFYAVHGANDYGFSISRAVNDGGGANLTFYKTRNSDAHLKTAVQAGDQIGREIFQAVAGDNSTVAIVGEVRCLAEAVNSTTITAAYVWVSNNNSIARLTASGNLGIGTNTNSPQFSLQVENSTAAVGVVNTSALGAQSGGGLELFAKDLPTAANQRLGLIAFGTRDGANVENITASIAAFSNGAFTSGVTEQTYLSFSTTATNALAEVMRITANGKVSIGAISTPSASFHVRSGFSSPGGAPIKVNPGTLLTTPEDGAIEFNGTHWYVDIGTTRYQVDQQVAANNGLSYTGSNVVLGQNVSQVGAPATLTSNREIPTATFSILLSTTNGLIELAPNLAQITVGSNTTFNYTVVGAGGIDMRGDGVSTFAVISLIDDNSGINAVITKTAAGLQINPGTTASNFTNNGEFLIKTATANGSTFYVNGTATFQRLLITGNTSTINLTAADSFKVISNALATGAINYNLPSAVQGLTYSFIVSNSFGISITAASGDTIRIGGSVTATGAAISALTIGTTVTIVAIDVTQWIGIAGELTWTF